MIARSIGAAPRQRGSSDGWTLSIGELGEQRLADQLPEGADDDRLGRGGADPLQRRLVVDVLGLQQLDPELARRPRRPAAAACLLPRPLAAVGRGDDERRAVRRARPAGAGPRRRTPRCRGRRSSRVGARLAMLALVAVLVSSAAGCSCRLRAAPAARPCAGRARARSRIRTPSRWSISCWSTRASRPEASSWTGSPSTSRPLTRACSGRSTSIETRGRLRQPSSATTSLVREPLDLAG